ncbi:MAG: MFS family permease [Candidatus Nitrosomirales archaeon]|jgi:MFS family permease
MTTILAWLNRDGKLLLAANIARMFGFGFVSIILAIYLKSAGYDALSSGIIITATLVSSSFFTFFASLYADRIGRRKILMLFSGLMVIAGLIFALTTDYYLLLVAALIGLINATGVNFGPFISIEQAILPQTSSDKKRNYTFALYQTTGTFAMAAGTLFAKIPEILQQQYGFDTISSFKPLFFVYMLIGLATIAIYYSLSKLSEVQSEDNRKKIVLSLETKSIVRKLSLLFGMDSFAGGFVIPTWVAFWFFTRFDAPLGEVSEIMFYAIMLTAISYLVAARLAGKIGLVNTMVFTHIPSNILLILLAIAPTLQIAIIVYLIRMSLSQMDVPTRQSYIVAIVKPEERTAVAGITNLSRNIPFSVSPTLVGYSFQFVSLAFPFFFAGALKTAYDLLLYKNFRKIKPPEEK